MNAQNRTPYNGIMDDATRDEIANCLDSMATESRWNGDLWQRCYDLVKANCDDELLAYLHDDLVHYTGTRSSGLNLVQPIYKRTLRSFETLLPHYALECHWHNSRSNMGGE